MSDFVSPVDKKFYLFGYPVAHSASPAFQNHLFGKARAGNSYNYWSTSKITEEVLETLKRDDCGGTGVTMPNKFNIIQYLDEVSPESHITGACNTIVKVAKPEGGFKYVGQNTDILGVRNALLRSLGLQHPDISFSSEAMYSAPVKGAGLVIGGGATTRSSIHALNLMGLSPIYLINRDPAEVKVIFDSMPHLTSKGGLIHLQSPEDAERHLVGEDCPKLLMAVGCIPAIPPSNFAERMVYSTAVHVFNLPYTKPSWTAPGDLPYPNSRLFLEMPYKPRRTPMLKIAEALGWDVIIGIEAMIEQGLAQQRMWLTGKATVAAGSDPTVLTSEMEESARKMVFEMTDVIVTEKEVDRAEGKSAASPQKLGA